MGLCSSTFEAHGAKPKQRKDELQTVLRGGMIFSLEVDAGLKAVEARQRSQPVTDSSPMSARPSSSLRRQQQQQQPASGDGQDQLESTRGSSRTTRAQSFTGPCGTSAAVATTLAATSNTKPSASIVGPTGEDGSTLSNHVAPAVISTHPAFPEARPLLVRRVRFDDSPIKTHGCRKGEANIPVAAAPASASPAASGAAPCLVGALPLLPRPSCGSLTSFAVDPAMSPAKAAAAAFAAAKARLRRSLRSPGKAAAAAAVPMSELIHSVATLSRAGREPMYRKQNQDNCFAFSQYCRPNQALLAALDGHGPHGHLVSDFLRGKMPLVLAEQLGESSSSESESGGGASATAAAADPAAALAATFQQTDEALRCSSGVNIACSGSTAVLCMLQGRHLTTAWVGDSRAVLARQEPRSCRAIPLTRDHKPGTPDERARILLSGGRVERLHDARGNPVGPQRVWLADSWVPGLAMSRALGDTVAHSVGVSSEPETSAVELCPQDRWLLLATDGVWEFIDPQMAVDIVSGCQSAEEACCLLVESAWSKWLVEEGVVDDITVVVVKLNVR